MAQRFDWRPAVALASEQDEAMRIEQLLGGRSTSGYLLRRPSDLMRSSWGAEGPDAEASFLIPEARTVWNSALPFSFNDGSLWAGRGISAAVTFGMAVWIPLFEDVGFRAVVAPQLLYQENEPFLVIPYPSSRTDPPRSDFANPFHPPPESLDVPLRFGDEPYRDLSWGQTSFAVEIGAVQAGWASENEWWGPGIRNAIVLSSHAPGVPRLFLSTARPVRTPLGEVEARWLVGRLEESPFFDLIVENQYRSLSAAALTLRPSFDPDLTVGVARAVIGAAAPPDRWVRGFLDAFRSVGRPNAQPYDSLSANPRDQVFSMFGRWLATSGFEAYWEWARFEEPRSLRDFLEFPQHSQAYTIGLQWVGQSRDSSLTVVQAELTNLEPSPTWRQRSVFSTYASRAVPHGFTHGGQILGASIGSGASSQWLAVERRARAGWRMGVFAGRIRWENAVLFTPLVPPPKREDVQLFWGLTGGTDLSGWSVSAELSRGIRLNYLFQSFLPDVSTGIVDGVDIANTSLVLTLARKWSR